MKNQLNNSPEVKTIHIQSKFNLIKARDEIFKQKKLKLINEKLTQYRFNIQKLKFTSSILQEKTKSKRTDCTSSLLNFSKNEDSMKNTLQNSILCNSETNFSKIKSSKNFCIYEKKKAVNKINLTNNNLERNLSHANFVKNKSNDSKRDIVKKKYTSSLMQTLSNSQPKKYENVEKRIIIGSPSNQRVNFSQKLENIKKKFKETSDDSILIEKLGVFNYLRFRRNLKKKILRKNLIFEDDLNLKSNIHIKEYQKKIIDIVASKLNDMDLKMLIKKFDEINIFNSNLDWKSLIKEITPFLNQELIYIINQKF